MLFDLLNGNKAQLIERSLHFIGNNSHYHSGFLIRYTVEFYVSGRTGSFRLSRRSNSEGLSLNFLLYVFKCSLRLSVLALEDSACDIKHAHQKNKSEEYDSIAEYSCYGSVAYFHFSAAVSSLSGK